MEDIFNTDVFDYVIINYLSSQDMISLYYSNHISEEKLCNYILNNIDTKLTVATIGC